MKTPEVEVNEPFTEQQELDEIESSGDPSTFYEERRTHVEEWELEEPLPETLGVRPQEPSSPWESALAETVEAADGDVVASEGMHCVARQMGHFYLEKGAFPAGNLRDYILTRCGVVAHDFANIRWDWDEVPQVSEAELADSWNDQGREKLAELANQGNHRSMGIWYGQNDDRALLLVTTGQRAAEVSSRPLHADSDEGLVLEGRLYQDFEQIEALRTESTFGYARCEADPTVELPDFRVTCARNEEADRTAIELVAFRRRRGLGEHVMSTAIWDDESDGAVFRPTEAGRAVAAAFDQLQSDANADDTGGASETSGDSVAVGESTSGPESASAEDGPDATPSSDDGAVESSAEVEQAREFIDLVNIVRQKAGMEPVVFERRQTEESERLVGRYFKAQYESGDIKTAEKIALGLMAGWEVEPDIVSGAFSSQAVQSTRAEVLLERMVATPSGRQVLLEPEVDRMAVGLTRPADRDASGALVTAYRNFPDEPHADRAAQAFETINEVRDNEGVSPVDRDTSLDNKIEELVRKVESNQLEPGEAQQQLMSVASRLWNRSVVGAWAMTSSLDELNLHDRLIRPGVERAAVMVVPYNDPDAAWTSYLVMTVFPAPDASMAAIEAGESVDGSARSER